MSNVLGGLQDSMAEEQNLDKHVDLDAVELLISLQNRANNLLAEFRSYQAFLQSNKKSNEVELRIFRRGVESEVKSLNGIEKVYERRKLLLSSQHEDSFTEDDTEAKQLHAMRSSNLPFYEAVWDVARSCRGITALGKRFYGQVEYIPGATSNERSSEINGTARRRSGKKGVIVDIVANDGLEWIKVSTITEKRLVFEMAKEGWEGYEGFSSSSHSELDDEDDRSNDKKRGKLELLKVAEDLKAASGATRIHYHRPRIRFVLPKITEGNLEEVDSLLNDIRSLGVTLQCGNGKDSSQKASHSCNGNDDFKLLLPSTAHPPLPDTINIDCTILLALISDISHLPRTKLPPPSTTTNPTQTHHKAILHQIEAEESSPMLPIEIYPVISDNRILECTSRAADRMREIVNTMGTLSERSRAAIILGEGEFQDQPPDFLREAFMKHSSHETPSSLNLPIKVIDFDFNPDEVSDIFQRTVNNIKLSKINTSVFMYGWIQDIVTLTSNRVVAGGIEKAINHLLDSDESERSERHVDVEFVGPKIYCCNMARSLVGKEKRKTDRSLNV